MLSDKQIENLIKCPKSIIETNPTKGMEQDRKSRYIKRKNMKLMSMSGQDEFHVFIRQNTMLTEQFSIGLLYNTKNTQTGIITLVRYNGEHGTSDWSVGQHYSSFHIHSINADLLDKGIYEPEIIEQTDRYTTIDQALALF